MGSEKKQAKKGLRKALGGEKVDWQNSDPSREAMAEFPKPEDCEKPSKRGRGRQKISAVEATRRMMRDLGLPEYEPPSPETIEANRLPSVDVPFCFALKRAETLEREKAEHGENIKESRLYAGPVKERPESWRAAELLMLKERDARRGPS